MIDENLNQLHAKATARLAKEEKDFTSTIVVSDSNTFVLPNNVLSAKRNTKKPLRYHECLVNYDDGVDVENKKVKEHSYQRRTDKSKQSVNHKQNLIVNTLQNCNVQLEKLPDLEIEPWCMIHCLYKCYCKGSSKAGKSFKLQQNINKKPESVSIAPQVVETAITPNSKWESIAPRKRQYTFENDINVLEPQNMFVSYDFC